MFGSGWFFIFLKMSSKPGKNPYYMLVKMLAHDWSPEICLLTIVLTCVSVHVSVTCCLKVYVSVRFVGGKLNMCYNAVDRHVEGGRAEQPAIIYDSPVTGTKQIITFRELQDQVNSFNKNRACRIEQHMDIDGSMI